MSAEQSELGRLISDVFPRPNEWISEPFSPDEKQLRVNIALAVERALTGSRNDGSASPADQEWKLYNSKDLASDLAEYMATKNKPKSLAVSLLAIWVVAFTLLVSTFASIFTVASLAGISVRSLTSMAALLSGRGRLQLRQEWAAHLAGESGHDPAGAQQIRQAFGFLVSAVRYRCTDLADAVWTPIDAILKSRTLSNLSVLIPTTAAGFLVLHHAGTLGVVTSADSIAAIAAGLYGLIRTGRWWRDVKPPEPKSRRAGNDG